jgi:hypothetical protein
MEISVMTMRETYPDIVSMMIMWGNRAFYSHIAICYADAEGTEMVFHATGEGVSTLTLEDMLVDHVIVERKTIRLRCSEEAFYGYVAGAVGKDYSESQFAGFIFPYRWIAWIVGDGEREMICSELIARVLKRFAGYKFDRDLDFISPKEIWELI